MHKIVKVEALEGYRLRVIFEDGVAGIVDLSERLFGPVFELLKDPAYFRQVGIDEFGAVCWPNSANLAPDALHARLRNQTIAVA
jgi:hypothetical protein